MKKGMLKYLAIVAAILTYAFPAYPWGDKGHEIIGLIAQEHLTDKARVQVQFILNGSSFVEAGLWPDHEGRKIPDLNSLHYVNFPKDGIVAYKLDRDCPDGNCVIEALQWFRKVLSDEEAPLNVRRIALRYVIHLAGDVHQPLHAGYREDRGGNDISVVFQGRHMNLHHLWDTGLIEYEGGSAAEIAGRINSSITAENIKVWQGGAPFLWALESLEFASNCAYKVEGARITDSYLKEAIPVMDLRLAQAGIRLAWVLNQSFK